MSSYLVVALVHLCSATFAANRQYFYSAFIALISLFIFLVLELATIGGYKIWRLSVCNAEYFGLYMQFL